MGCSVGLYGYPVCSVGLCGYSACFVGPNDTLHDHTLFSLNPSMHLCTAMWSCGYTVPLWQHSYVVPSRVLIVKGSPPQSIRLLAFTTYLLSCDNNEMHGI